MRLQCFPPKRYVKNTRGVHYLEKFPKLEYSNIGYLLALYGSTVLPRWFACFVWFYCAS